MKKLIAYQKLLLSSIPSTWVRHLEPPEKLIFGIAFCIFFLMDWIIFTGNTSSTGTMFFIGLPIICVWMINKILYGSYRLFEIVPVSRKYVVLNILLMLIVDLFIVCMVYWIISAALIGILIGMLYLVFPQSFSEASPESAIPQIIDTTKANLLMTCVLAIILFVGIAITFIKNKKIRMSSFTAFTAIGYGLLLLLKNNMPISPNSDKVEFLESFSIMPESSIIVSCVAVATVIICIASGFISYKLYVPKGKCTSINIGSY